MNCGFCISGARAQLQTSQLLPLLFFDVLEVLAESLSKSLLGVKGKWPFLPHWKPDSDLNLEVFKVALGGTDG